MHAMPSQQNLYFFRFFKEQYSQSTQIKSRMFKIQRRFPHRTLNTELWTFVGGGGGERDRTDDLLLAKQALSQLSYTPDK